MTGRPAGGQATYAEREDLLLDSLSTRKVNTGQHDGPHRAGRTGFWTTQGRLARGIADSTTWTYLSAAIADADGSADAGGANGGFSGWPGMDTWVRWNQVFPQNIRDQYYTEYTTMPTYGSGSTPNQRMMWAVACRIACETWGSNEVLQVSNAANGYPDKTGRDYILAKCDRTVKWNFEERWAKHYLEYTLGPLRTLADLSTDPVLRQRARMTWNWGWMDIASASFNGRWSLPAGRGSLTTDGNTYDISEFGSWLMFGGPSPSSLLDADQSMLYTQPPVPPAEPPPPLAPEMLVAATTREAPYTRRGLARLFETQFATAYVRSNYTLYSQLEGDTTLNADGTIKVTDLNNNGVPSNDWSSERWGLMWDDAPGYGPAGLNMKPPTTYGWCTNCGIGPGEDVVQHEGTLVGILNIPTNSGMAFTRDYIPTNTLAEINETATTGWLFLHYRSVLVSIYRTDPGVFQYPAPASTFCEKRGFALETAAPEDYPGATAAARLDAFRTDVLAHSGAETSQVWDATNRMIYADRHGHVLDITFGRGGIIDGEPVDYESWPLNESPWSYQQQMGNMFVFGAHRTLLWNFKNWTEQTNNRPVVTTAAPATGGGANFTDVNLALRVRDAETPASNLQFRILAASNGAVRLLADGRTARYTPAADYAGAAGFDFTAGDTFVDHRLLFHYDFESPDPVAGGLARDASTLDRHASALTVGLGAFAPEAATPPALAGQSTGALRFASSGLGAARLFRTVYPASVSLNNADWTFAAWFNRASYADHDFIFYVGTGDGFSGGVDELQLYCPAQTRTLRVYHYSSSNVLDVALVSPDTVGTGEWHHAALSFERAGYRRGHVHLYLDGARVGTQSNVTWALDQSSALVIGGVAADSAMDRSFRGALDDVALYRGRLGTSEIARLAGGAVAQVGGLLATGRVIIVARPAAPAGLAATPLGGAIQLTWQAAPGASGYLVRRSLSAGGPFTNVADGIEATAWADGTAVAGVSYYYLVAATNAAGIGPDSNVAGATIPTPDPSLWADGGLTGWTHGARIAFPGYARAEALTNIPLLVTLGTNIPGFRYDQFASPQGYDVWFTTGTGSNRLNHEIERWNTNGESYVWVQVPRLTNGAAIALYWGNPDWDLGTAPDAVSNLALWLKADGLAGLTNGQAVSVWPDASTNARNATLATGSIQYVTNAINGKPAVRFAANGSSTFVFPALTTIRTVFWVVRESTNGAHFLLGDDNTYHFHRGSGGEIFSGPYASTNVKSGATRLMGLVVNATNTLLGAGWRIVSTITAGNAEASTLSRDRAIAGRSWDGDIAEVIIYNRALTAAEESRVGRYLAQKYALATAYASGAPAYTTDGSTWSNGFTGVWHLDSTNMADSSPNPQPAAANSAGLTNGVVGGGLYYGGTSQTSSIPHHADFDLASGFEVQGWFRIAAADKPAANDYRTLTAKELDASDRNWWLAIGSDGRLRWKSSPGIDLASPSDVADGQWHHVAAVHGGSAARLYLDGVPVAYAASPGLADVQDAPILLGAEGASRHFKGALDEFRISQAARSSNWIWAVYRNIASNGAFVRAAPASGLDSNAAPQVRATGASAITSTGATLNGVVSYAGAGGAHVQIVWGTNDAGTNTLAWASNAYLGVRPTGPFGTNIGGLVAGQTYAVRVLASNGAGSAWSPEAPWFTTRPGASDAPALVPADGKVGLAWPRVPGATSYTVKRALVRGGPYAAILGGILGTNFTDATAAMGVTNYFVLSAANAAGEGADSPETAVFPVEPPASLSPAASNAAVSLSWSTVAGAASYAVRRTMIPGGVYADRGYATNTSYLDTAVTNGVTYYYIVQAMTPGFESASSPESAATPAPAPAAPTGLTAAGGNASATLSWSPASNAWTYKVKRSTTNGGPYSTVASGLLDPSYVNSGLVNGTTYDFVVSAVNGAGESPNSAPAAATPAVLPTSFTNGSGGNWNAPAWTPNPPGKPVPAFDTRLVFTNAAAIGSTNDMGEFLLNQLLVTRQSVALSGNGLSFAGAGPTLIASQNVAHTIAVPMTLSKTTTVSVVAGTTTVTGVLGGQGGLAKSGAGTLVLAAANAYAGPTTIGAGVLRIQHGAALGPDAGGTAIGSGGTLELPGGVTVAGEALTLTGSGAGGALRNVSGTNTWAGDITAVAVSGVARIGCDSGLLRIAGDIQQDNTTTDQLVLQGAGAITIDGVIRGNSRVTCSSEGAGTRTLAGENTYSGQTMINGGILVASSINRVTNGLDRSSLGAPLTAAAGTISMGYSGTTGTLRYTGAGEDTDRVLDLAGGTGGAMLDHAGSGRLRFTSDVTASGAGAKTLTLQVGAGGVGEIAGAIVNNSSNNPTAVTKTGPGVWILSGTNTCTGPTVVKAGELILDARVGGSLAVSNGILSGEGSVAGDVTVVAGTNAPGRPVGALRVGGNYTLASNATLRLEITGPGTGVDRIERTGPSGVVTLAGGLSLQVTNPVPTNTPFVVIDHAGTAAVVGAFSGKPQGATFIAGAYLWRVSYTNGDGNDVAVTAVAPTDPAPAAPTGFAALALGPSQVRVSWGNAATNAVGFLLERATDGGANFVVIADLPVATNRFDDLEVRHDRTYVYRMRAYASFASLSAYTPAVGVTTPSATARGFWTTIAFTNYPAAEGLTNFPVMVVLGTNIPGFHYTDFLDPFGGDLRFLSADREVDLNYEIEQWNPGGASVVWVQIPRFTNGCSILSGWGDPAETNAPPGTTNGATWSEGFLGVWHLAETADAHVDSSARLPTTRVANVAAMGTATGIAGPCDRFDGNGEYVSLPDLGTNAAVTVECWVNLAAIPAGADIGLVSSDPWIPGVTHFKTSGGLQIKAQINGGGTVNSSSGLVAVGGWSYAAYTIAGAGTNDLRSYLDGRLIGSAIGRTDNDLTDVNIAREYSGRYLNGRVDEVRISSVARSSNWLWAVHRNLASNAWFTSYGPVSVAASNTAPSLAAVSNRVVGAGQWLIITNVASDSDVPMQTLTFSLAQAPSNANVGATNGVFRWRPGVLQAGTNHLVALAVSDDGVPPLGATQQFVVTVPPLGPASLSRMSASNGVFAFQVEGDAGPDYYLEGSTNFASWYGLATTNAASPPLTWLIPVAPAPPQQFFRTRLGP